MSLWRSTDSCTVPEDPSSPFNASSDLWHATTRPGMPLARISGTWSLRYSDEWKQELKTRLQRNGVVDFREALLLDVTGVEVRPFNNNEDLSPDRFPLRILSLGQQWHNRSKSICSDRPSTSAPPAIDAEMLCRHQITGEILFEDVWPGILDLKMSQQGLTVHGPILVTDVTGARIDIDVENTSSVPTMPAPYRFPLMLFLRTPRVSVQNMPASTIFSGQADLMERTVEIPLMDILRDVVDWKLQAMGLPVSPKTRSLALITDPTGVVVTVEEGIPDRSRFPLKFYINGAALREVWEASGSVDHVRHHRWRSAGHKDVNQALQDKLSFFRNCFKLSFSNSRKQQH